jgi:hypothetical protein
MPAIEIEESGLIEKRDSAYPTVVRLDDGDLLAAYTIGGGPLATGGTVCSRSRDIGRTWERCSVILPRGEDPPTRNSLRLSKTEDGTVLAYGMEADRKEGKMQFGEKQRRDPVLCYSPDEGVNWSAKKALNTPISGPFEISNPILVLRDGRWLAPATTMESPDRLGERVLLFESADEGETWPHVFVAMKDPGKKKGFFEKKVIELDPGHLLMTAWTVTLPEYTDIENHFTVSRDGGKTWCEPRSTGIQGQTLTPVWIGRDRLLVLYNRRYGDQGVQGALVRFTDESWEVLSESTIWDARASRRATDQGDSGLEELKTFAFGLPSALCLDVDTNTYLAVHWCEEGGICGIRWTRLRIIESKD